MNRSYSRASTSVSDASRSRCRICAAVEALEIRLVLSTVVVNTFVDQTDSPTSTTVSLRDAIARAAAHAGSDTIEVPAGTYPLTQGELLISDTSGAVTINATGGAAVINPQSKSRAIEVAAGTTVSASGLTITGGNASYGGGGGILNDGMLTLTNTTISGNNTNGSNSTGINSSASGALKTTSSTITGNSDVFSEGGGIYNDGTLNLANVTISGNSAERGAALYNGATATASDCTIVGNSGIGEGYGAVQSKQYPPTGVQSTIGNTIIADNSSDADVSGVFYSLGGNLIGNADGGDILGASDKTGTSSAPLDPKLTPLGNFGGATQTCVPLAGSPVLAGGVVAAVPAGVATDQRGLPRVVGGKVDIGAVEVQAAPLIAVQPPARQSFNTGTMALVSLGSISDPQGKGPFTVEVDWGDGTPDTLFTQPSAGAITAQSHRFGTSGIITGSIAVTDSGGDLSNLAAFSVSNNPAPAVSFVVNTVKDQTDPPGSKTVSLRDAVADANKGLGPVTISFDPTVFAKPQTITLGTINNYGLELSNAFGATSVIGPAAGLTVTDDGGTTLTVDAGVTASLSGLSISAGTSTGGYIPNPGPALVNSGTLTVTASSITDCPDGGAGNSGTLVVQNSAVSNNAGGGISSSGALALQNCTIANNSGYNGGALYNSGTATVTGCAFFANVLLDQFYQPAPTTGAAIDNTGTLKLTNSTLSGNSADGGAAIYNSATAAVSDCTITANNDNDYMAGAITNRGSVTLANSIVAGNTAYDGSGDVSGAFKSQGHNLIGIIDDNSSGWLSSDLTGTNAHPLNPDLSPLGAHGGPTATQFPLAGSPAIGAGSVALIPAGVTTDQRGFARVVGGKVDIGAVELQKTSVVTVTPPAAQDAVAGVPAVIKLGSFTDPGGKGPFTVDVNWGDGSPDTVYSETAAGSLGSQTHSYIITGSLKGSITVTDASGDVSQPASLPVTAAAAAPVTITVNTTADQTDPAGSKTVSLRDAVSAADASYGPVTIAFDSTVFATDQTIKLGSPLELDDNRFGTISLAGPAAGVTLSGQTIVIDSGITASISRLTITGANSTHGGIENAGTLTVTDSIITGNTAMQVGKSRGYIGGGLGGGIDNTGTATIIDTAISDNSAKNGYYGGGGGGGISNSGILTLTDSTVSGNNADYGAGILNAGGVSNPSLTLTNSTIASNVASAGGGGLENSGMGTVAISDCTLTGNTGGQGDPQTTGSGGIANRSGTISIANTIVAANIDAASAAPDAAGPLKSLGHNLIGNTAGSSGWTSSDLTGTSAHPLDPDLTPLGNHGGPTQTLVPLPGSPALGAGAVALVPAGVSTDQRGFARVVNGKVDIGAVEVQNASSLATITGTVFNDANGDGAQDNGETGLAGVQVYADLGNVGYFVTGDPTTTTNATGGYTLPDLAAGNYIIRQVRPLGYAQTTPSNGFGHHVTISAGQTLSGQNFGDKSAAAPPATISGTVFNDINGDGTQDAGETGIADVEVYIDLDNVGYFVTGDPTTMTDASGDYTLTGLAAGSYIVRQALPLGYIQTTPANGYGHHVTVSAGQTLSAENFGDKAQAA